MHERTPPRTESRPLRILMVLESDFKPRGGGGAESQVRTLSVHLKRLGQEVTVLTPMLAQSRQVAAERLEGLPVVRLRYPRWKKIGGALMCVRLAAFLWQRRHHYDAWHVHIGHRLGAVTCLLGDWLHKPVVVKISGWWELEEGVLAPKVGLAGRLARRWLRRATAVQAISTRIAAELDKSGFAAGKVLVLPNAVDTARFQYRPRQRKPGDTFTAVFVGRLVAEKGLGTLFDAWAQAFGARTDVQLLLVGGGALEAELREKARTLGIASSVQLLGHSDRVEDVLTGAHLGLLPSRIEGLSNTLLEFMASGLPVAATRVSGSEDFVVTGHNGWLFPVGDATALAACLREAEALPSDRLEALGRAARAAVVEAAGLERVTGRLLSLYRGAQPRELG